jgi:hypothetical protein
MNQQTRTRAAIAAGTAIVTALAVSIGAVGAADAPAITSGVAPATIVTQPPVVPVAANPEPTVPESTVPESTISKSTVPESTISKSSVPESTVPPVLDRLVLVGDSLADESAPVIEYFTAGLPIVSRHMGGTAPCDWLDDDLQATSRSVVVITFTGNNLTPCMLDAAGAQLRGDALVAKYRTDVATLVDRARAAGAWVVLVGQPNHRSTMGHDQQVAGINAAYRAIAERLPRVAFVDAGAAVESPDGSYTDRLPCTMLDTDCSADGTTVVRGDGLHFCPVVKVHPCPVWSSGAMRYGLAIVGAATNPAPFD